MDKTIGKILWVVIGLLLAMLVLYAFSEAATPEQMEKIYEWAEANSNKETRLIWRYAGEVVLVIATFEREETITYSTKVKHRLDVITARVAATDQFLTCYAIWIDRHDDRKLYCPGVTQTEVWNIGSYGHYGTADKIFRDFRLYHPDAGIILPLWPADFINPLWIHPSKEEAQKVLDTEINRWIEEINLSNKER